MKKALTTDPGKEKMQNESLHNPVYEKLFPSEDVFYTEAFSRNLGLLSRSEQEFLHNSKIAIPGMGGVGGLHLINLIRLGIGNFHIADFDSFEIANMNRQYGAKISNLHRSKVHCMVKEAKEINPYVQLQVFETAITEDNIDAFLKDVDVVIDSIDFFQIQARRLLFNKAREKGIHVITAGPIGYSTAMLIFSPDEMSFDTYFNIHEGMEEKEMLYHFAIGLCPKATHMSYMDLNRVNFESKKGPSLNLSCQLCTAAAATEVIRILLHPEKVKAAPHYFQYDLWSAKFIKGYLFWGNRNPIQKFKITFLKRKLKTQSIALANKPTDQKTILHEILEAGILAPSGDNAQPWKFKVAGDKISIYIDKNSDTSFFNINQIASLISCGAVVENMRIAAASQYLNVSIAYPISALSKTQTIEEVAQLKIERSITALPDSLYSFIRERHTNRTTYNKKEIPEKSLQKLEKAIADIENVTLQLITNNELKQQVAELVYKADLIRAENKDLHEYLMKMIRFNSEDAIRTRDGFHIKNLEAGFDGEQFLKFTKSWKRMNLLNKIGMSKMVAKVSKLGIEQSSAIGLIKATGRNVEDFINAGRAMQRIWLTATSLGIDFQPMTAITLFWMRFQYGQKDTFSENHKLLLEQVWNEYNSIFNTNGSEAHILLFRIGYGKYVKVKTLRKDISEFMI